MINKTFLTAVFFLAYTMNISGQGAKFMKVAKDGTGNIIFSNLQINKDQESKVTLKTKFTSSEPIFARAYFSSKFIALEGEAVGFIDLWIDGKHVKRLEFTNNDVKAGNDQMQIYVHNTDPKADFSDDLWNELSSGEHKVKIVVGRTEFMKAAATLSEQGNDVVVKEDDVYKPIYLSDSNFTFVKE